MRDLVLKALPGTAAEVVLSTGLPKRNVQYHLDKLRSLGLVSVSPDRSRLGRPGHIYTRTSKHIDASLTHIAEGRRALNPFKPAIRRDPFTEAFFGPAT
jgi:predicted ArsR family transcriptional regulator